MRINTSLGRLLIGLVLMGQMMLPPAGHAAGTITARAWVSQANPHVQETVVYTVRIYSTDSLRTIELTPPTVQGALLEELEGPLTGAQMSQGRRYFTNDYHFALTPMKPGALEVGQVRMKVTTLGKRRWGGGYQPQNGEGAPVLAKNVRLRVRPAATDSRSWRPLQYLDIKALWAGLEDAEEGEPLTLTVVTKARGATGAQLPRVADLLKTPDFKVYPERPDLDTKVTGNGAYVWGRRVETFTLIPTRDGGLPFPSLSLTWWDLGAKAQSIGEVAERLILVGDAAREAGVDAFVSANAPLSARLFSWGAFYYLALPVGVALAVAFGFGWWLGAGQPPSIRIRNAFMLVLGWLRAGAKRSGGVARATARIVVPAVVRERVDEVSARWWKRLRAEGFDAVMTILPKRAMIWWCSRCVEGEEDPEGVSRALGAFACANLSMSPNATLRTIAERIIADYPTADAPAFRRLFHDLDDAVYGGKVLVLSQWKQAFRPLFRSILTSPKRETGLPRFGLPELNP